MLVPEHMDIGSRNQRLYETLKGMGLFVVPVPDENDPSRIARIIVSADLPAQEFGVTITEDGQDVVRGPGGPNALPMMTNRKFIGRTDEKVVNLAEIYRVPQPDKGAD